MSRSSVHLTRDDRVGNEEGAVLYTSVAKTLIVPVAQLENVPLERPVETKILMPGPKASFSNSACGKAMRCLPFAMLTM